ncbi:MAG: TetR/AcrR family transcriptional regulator [Actinomycetes bacterium]
MPEPVKPRRSYNSPRRQEQAAATRRSILETAHRLFEQRGYPATTMEEIAAGSGVALKTVYVAFTTKSGVLRALWDLLLKGDEDEAAVAQRSWYRQVLDEPDPRRQLRLNARNSRTVKVRVAGVLKVIRAAAPIEPDIQALWTLIQSDFYDNQRTIVESLHAKRALRRGLDVDRAADILWTLNHPDLWLLLTEERHWTAEQWQKWFTDTTCAQLLRDSPR